jgi:glycosyltransferase involved in cell wall biosynthesis
VTADMVACSVIIAARNAERFFPETLASLACQTFTDFEVLIVDDGSTDMTAQIARTQIAQDSRYSLLNGPARGVSAARNLGFERSTGEWIVFLDADDLLAADALSRIADTLAAYPDAIGALGGIARIAEDGSPMPSSDNRNLARGVDPLGTLLRKNYIVNGGAFAIRREILDLAGTFDETLAYGEDWELWCRVLALGHIAIIEGETVLAYRQVGTGANYKAREDAFARRVTGLDVVAANPNLRTRFGKGLGKALRARRIDIFWSGVRSELQFGDKTRAAMLGVGGLILYPDTVLRPSLALRFLKSLRRS